MPRKLNRADYNAYMRVYMLKRYRARMKYAFQQLGGRCKRCGAAERLECDHIDPRTKSFTISQLWSVSKKRFDAELSKCQLLCRDCHAGKTLTDIGHVQAKGRHGTKAAYRYCHCNLCREAQAAYFREYRKRKPRKRDCQCKRCCAKRAVYMREYRKRN